MSLDMVVLRLREERLELLLETRIAPFAHCWQLPALRIDETRIGIWTRLAIACWQSGGWRTATASRSAPRQPGRDPRGWSTTLVYPVPGGSRWGRCAAAGILWMICPTCNSPSTIPSWSPWGWAAASRAVTAPRRCTCWGGVHPLRGAGVRDRPADPMNTAAFRQRIHRADILTDTGRKRTGKQRPAILYRLESPCCVMFDQVMNGAEERYCYSYKAKLSLIVRDVDKTCFCWFQRATGTSFA